MMERAMVMVHYRDYAGRSAGQGMVLWYGNSRALGLAGAAGLRTAGGADTARRAAD